MEKKYIPIILYIIISFFPIYANAQTYNNLTNDVVKPLNEWEKQYVDEQTALQRNKIAAQANVNQSLDTAIKAFNAHNDKGRILAGVLTQEMAAASTAQSNASRDLETAANVYAQQEANRRQELIKKRAEMIQQQLIQENQMREHIREIYPDIAVIPIGVDYHYIEKSYDDEEFVIDYNEYEAMGYCYDMKKGDPVIFVESNPDVCVTAQILNLRTMRACRVWCH